MLCLIAVSKTLAVPPLGLMPRVADPVVTSESVCPAEGLFFAAQVAPHFLLSRVVDGVLVSREIVWPREYLRARLARTRIDTIALVRPSLRVEQTWFHAGDDGVQTPTSARRTVDLTMSLSFVLLQEDRCLKTLSASMIGAGIRPGLCEGGRRPFGAAFERRLRYGHVSRTRHRRHW